MYLFIQQIMTLSPSEAPAPTFALRFEIAMNGRGRGFNFRSTCRIHRVPPYRRCGGSYGTQWGGPEAHVGRRGDLPPEGSVLACSWQGRHGDVVGILDGGVSGASWREPDASQELLFF